MINELKGYQKGRFVERNDIEIWRKWNLVVNVLLIGLLLFGLARLAWGLDI